jgi:dephospho-CoA kinase
MAAASRFDATVLVTASVAQQRARLQQTRHYTRAQADARMAAQWPLADKVRQADYLLDNSGTPAALHRQVVALTQRLREDKSKE